MNAARRSTLLGSLALLACHLAACAESPHVRHPELDLRVPSAAWNDVESSEPLDTWWASFGDPGLDAAVARALEHNVDLEIAAERVLGAAAQSRIQGADAFPQAAAGFLPSRSRQNFIGLPIPGSQGGVLTTRFTSLALNLTFDWEVDLWGRIRAGHAAALADLEAAASEAWAARLSITSQVSKNWFRLVEAERQLEIATATLENFRQNHRRVASRFESGLASSLDTRLSLVSIAGAEAAVAARRQVLDVLRRGLEVLLGDYPSGELPAPSDIPPLTAELPGGLPADLVARRPDLAAAERRLAAAGARLDASRRALYPRLSLTASGGTSSSELKDLVNGNFSVWTLAANLAQPLFQGGRLLAGIDLAEARQREALASYVQVALAAYREVEQALSADLFLAARETALAEAAEQALAARDQAEERYARGLADIVTVLESQRSAFESESQWIEVKRERLENRVDLFVSLGGDFRPGDPLRPTASAAAVNPPTTNELEPGASAVLPALD